MTTIEYYQAKVKGSICKTIKFRLDGGTIKGDFSTAAAAQKVALLWLKGNIKVGMDYVPHKRLVGATSEHARSTSRILEIQGVDMDTDKVVCTVVLEVLWLDYTGKQIETTQAEEPITIVIEKVQIDLFDAGDFSSLTHPEIVATTV